MKVLKLIDNHIKNRTLPSEAESEAYYHRYYKKHWTHIDDYAIDCLRNKKCHPSYLEARHHLKRVKTIAWMIIEAVAKESKHCKECCELINFDWDHEKCWTQHALCRKCYRKHE